MDGPVSRMIGFCKNNQYTEKKKGFRNIATPTKWLICHLCAVIESGWTHSTITVSH